MVPLTRAGVGAVDDKLRRLLYARLREAAAGQHDTLVVHAAVVARLDDDGGRLGG